MSMRGIFEQVIARGGFDLTAMLARIDEYHIEGKLDDDERDASTQPPASTPIRSMTTMLKLRLFGRPSGHFERP